MGDKYTVRLPTRHEEAVEDMQERNDADSDSEALRELLDAGMAQYGYVGRTNGETALKTYVSRFAWAFALIGITWLATTIYLPVALRIPAAVSLALSAGMFGLEKTLDAREPRVTKRLQAWLPGGEKA